MNSQKIKELKSSFTKFYIIALTYLRYPVTRSLNVYSLLDGYYLVHKSKKGYIFFSILITFCILTYTSFVFTPFLYAFQYLEIFFSLKLPEHSILEVNSFVYKITNAIREKDSNTLENLVLGNPVRLTVFLITPCLIVKLGMFLRNHIHIIGTYHLFYLLFKYEGIYIPSEYFKHIIVFTSMIITVLFILKSYTGVEYGYMGTFPNKYRITVLYAMCKDALKVSLKLLILIMILEFLYKSYF